MKVREFLLAGAAAGVALIFTAATSKAVVVSSAAELANAVAEANGGGDREIVLRDGTYRLDDMLQIAAAGVTVSSLSGNRGAAIIEGHGMTGDVTHIFNVNGSNFTVRDMTLRGVANHAVQLQVGVDGLLLSNLHILDTYEQMVKIPYDAANMGLTSNDGIMEDCLLEYTAGIGPQYYIGGIDAHNARNWIVRNNIFRGVRSPSGETAEYAVHFWSDSRDTLVENNYIINCDRGIGFGMGEDRGHHGGIIRNNMIYHDDTEGFADVGIAIESCPDARIYNNTVFQEHSHPNAIEYRFAATTNAQIYNNLTNRAISDRASGATGDVDDNVTDAESGWFANLFTGDLHLADEIADVVNQGREIDGLTEDIDGGERPAGEGYDIGADEYDSGTYDIIPPPPTPDSNAPVPNLTVNGSDGPVTVSRGETVTAVVSLDPRAQNGVYGDWWLMADTPFGLFYYTFDGWMSRETPAHQGPLFSLGSYHVFTMDVSGLQSGTYTLNFAVDTSEDGAVNLGSLYYDTVDVIIN